MTSSVSEIANSPASLAFFTIAAATAIAVSLENRKIHPMATKEEVIAAAGEPKLPEGFIVDPFTNSRGQSLFTIHLPRKDTDSPPKAALFLIHGVAEHCCRSGYLHTYQCLADAGIDIFSLDHHGHGRSDGEPRGYAEKFEYYVDDVLGFIESCKKKYTDRGQAVPPVILMGQSMGGLISLLTVLRLGSSQVSGIVLTSPALGVDMNLELKVQKFFAPFIDMAMPKAKIVDAVPPVELSRNKEAVQAYVDDPLCGKGKLIARTAIGMDKSFDLVKERRSEITCPILILHGTDDKVTSANASKDFFENVGTPKGKKQLLELPGLYHEILEEPEADQLILMISSFVSSGGSEFAKVEGEDKDGVVHVVFKPASSG